ncbi:MAG: ATP-binding protein [Lentimicrobiaceae bacterium]|jgi:hypothetical protein
MQTENWIHPNTITGPPAEGVSYIRRPNLNQEFWRELKKGSHILFTAPRRVGKTSVMKDLVANPPDGFVCIYEDVESDQTLQEFYKRLYFLILNRLGSFEKSKKILERWLKSRGIEEISMEGSVKFKEKKLDYKEELLQLIKHLPELDKRVVLFLDEFPEVISAIRRNESTDNAIELLHTIREIRLNKDFNHCTLVLAGSIGLEHVVESLDRLKLINDLHPVYIEPLTRDEAKLLISQITKGATIQWDRVHTETLLDRIKLLIPYFLQLMIEECDNILFKKNRRELENEDIGNAFEEIIRKNENLNDWKDRLKLPYIEKDESSFCKKILTILSHANSISIQEIYNEAKSMTEPDNYMNLIKMLIRDGYITEASEGNFRFSSPLLQAWWKKQHPLI